MPKFLIKKASNKNKKKIFRLIMNSFEYCIFSKLFIINLAQLVYLSISTRNTKSPARTQFQFSHDTTRR